MYVEADSMDQIQREIIKELVRKGRHVPSRVGWVQELTGFTFRLNNPRSRLIFSPTRKFNIMFAIGELLWYLRGSNSCDIIGYYNKRYPQFSDDGKTLHGSYGRRLFTKEPTGYIQWDNILDQLKKDPYTRRALIHLHMPQDSVLSSLDVPCTCYIQFLIRNGKLEVIVSMRSNDVIWGTAYDVFSFTMIQEIMAKQLDLELGPYVHFAGSIHLYDRHSTMAQKIITESSYPTYEMPPMPKNPWKYITGLLQIEENLRLEHVTHSWPDDTYWYSLAQILQYHTARKNQDSETLEAIRSLLPLCYACLVPHI